MFQVCVCVGGGGVSGVGGGCFRCGGGGVSGVGGGVFQVWMGVDQTK